MDHEMDWLSDPVTKLLSTEVNSTYCSTSQLSEVKVGAAPSSVSYEGTASVPATDMSTRTPAEGLVFKRSPTRTDPASITSMDAPSTRLGSLSVEKDTPATSSSATANVTLSIPDSAA